MCFTESVEGMQGLRGIIVSPYIGAKVFLNSISGVFGFAPTKVRMIMASKDDKNDVVPEEIQTKGVCTKRLIDFAIKEDSKLFIQ